MLPLSMLINSLSDNILHHWDIITLNTPLLWSIFMKIRHLLESTSELAQELMQPKYKEYSHGIKRLLDDDWQLVRGSGHYDPDEININSPRVDRKPAYASTMLYYHAFKNLEPWKSLPPRSVICTTSVKYASSYVASLSGVFYIIPKNGTILCKLPDVDLWESFDSSTHFGLKARYSTFEEMSERIEAIISKLNGGIEITTENFIKCLKIASDKLDDDDSMLWEYSMTLQDKGFFKMVVDYFNIYIITSSIDNVDFADKDHEVWFSSEYLTIPYDMVHK